MRHATLTICVKMKMEFIAYRINAGLKHTYAKKYFIFNFNYSIAAKMVHYGMVKQNVVIILKINLQKKIKPKL